MADYHQILSALRGEREQLDEAILTMERLVVGGKKRRGRPPKWMGAFSAGAPGRTRKPFSKETRARMADSQRKRWAAKARESKA